MFFPVGDTPNPPDFTPWVTRGLMAANVLVFLAITLPLSGMPVDPADPMLREWLDAIGARLPPGVSLEQVLAGVSRYDLFTFEHGYKPGAPSSWDLFASMFLHGGLMHLAGNMLMLWIYGDNVEHRLGRLRYLLAYLGGGVVATLTFGAFADGSMVPMVGASGAISAVLGMYFVWFPKNKVKVFVALFPFFFNVLLVPARIVLGIFLVFDNLLPVLAGGGGGVAYGAHIGGFIGGLALGWGGDRLGIGLSPRMKARLAQQRGRAGERRRAAVEQGRAAQRPSGPGQVLDLDARRRERDLWRSGATEGSDRLEQASAALATGRMWLAEGYPAAALQHLALASKLDPDGPIGAEARDVMRDLGVR